MKRKKKAGVNPRLAQSLYRALVDYWVRIAGVTYGKVDDLSLDCLA